MKNAIIKELKLVGITLIAAVISALGLWVFVFPFDFAPSGVDGVTVILQEITGLNAGYFNLILNATLLVIAWFCIKKRFVVYTFIFTTSSSLLCILFEVLRFYQYSGESVIATLFAGILAGVCTSMMLKISASSGGVDIIATMIQKKNKHINIERIISIICYVIVALSIFVFKDLNCVLLSIIQVFAFEVTSRMLLKDTRNAIEVKIVCDEIDKLKEDILIKLNHTATVVKSEGLYSQNEKQFVFVVINVRQLKDLLNILKNYPNSFVYYSDVMGVHGYFER